MLNISLNDQSFRYDVHSLVKAFYPYEELNFDITNEKYPGNTPDADFADILRVRIPEQSDSRIGIKNEVKRLIYDILKQRSKRELPWGTLTGIRPIKIPIKLLKEGKSVEDISKYMKEVYYTSTGKISLATDIAKRQLSIMEGLHTEESVSIYIGIPFCPSICAYCSFSSYALDIYKDRVRPYLDALKKEIESISFKLSKKRIISIYIGGGTPTTLSEKELEELCNFINCKFNLLHLREFSVECGRPDSITKEKLKVLKSHNINRICINPQSMNDKTLKLVGRNHTEQDIKNAFNICSEFEFEIINSDLIAGLPKEGKDEVKYTLNKIKNLDPDSLTVHALALKRASRINRDWDESLSYGDVDGVMELFSEYAKETDMVPYYLYRQKQIAGNLENIGYAKTGAHSIYNILIMGEFHDIIGLGAGSVSKLLNGDKKPERVANVKDVDEYINRIDEMIERKAAWL